MRRVVPGARALALVACLRRGAEHADRTLQHTPFAAGREHTLRGSRLEVSTMRKMAGGAYGVAETSELKLSLSAAGTHDATQRHAAT